MDQHEYSGQYTYTEFLRANRMHLSSRRSMKIMRVVMVFLLVVATLIAVVDPREVINWVILVAVLAWLSYPYTVLPITAKRSWAEQKQGHGPIKIVLARDRIISTSYTGDSTTLWLHHYLVSDQMILLFETPKTFIMLPRRFARNESDYQYVQEFLTAFPVSKQEPGKLR
jgi:hypothetical protein